MVLLGDWPAADLRRLRRRARGRGLVIVVEARGQSARVHDQRELSRALAGKVSLILLSPLFETASHPDWAPLPRMRAATLARLARRKLVALGGMDARRFRRVGPLGFQSWAGISAFRI
jgi:thiamine-phosphate pyrophosphorylase